MDDGYLVYHAFHEFCLNRNLTLNLTTSSPQQLNLHLHQTVNLMNAFSINVNCTNVSREIPVLYGKNFVFYGRKLN